MTSTERRIAILLLALTAYGPALRLGFLWDDHIMIEANPTLRAWSAANIRHDFTTDVFDGHGDGYYRPLQTLMNRVDYTIWGLRPFGYHLTNFLFHAAASVLVSELAMALALGPLAALLVGCFFAVHPIGVEQLMIIAGRAELMSFAFMLASLLCFLEEGPVFLAAGIVAYAAALFSKESAVITPALFALLLWFRKAPRKRYHRLWIYVGLTLPYLILRSFAVGTQVPPISPTILAKFLIIAFPKILTAYARLVLVPWNLHSHRMIPRLSHFWFLYLLIWISAIVFLARMKYRLELFCVGWFILTLLPKTPAMMLGNFTLDHWAYPASFGLFVLIAKTFVWLWQGKRAPWRRGSALLLFPILIGWALLARLNIELRGTDEKMYRWALNFTASHPIKYNLGVLLLSTGRAQEAILYFQDVYALYPENADNLHALAMAYWQTGHKKLATRLLKKLVTEHPTYTPGIQSLNKINMDLPKK